MQSNTQHREEEPQNTKYCITKRGPNKTPTNNGSNNKQWINNNRFTALEWTAAKAIPWNVQTWMEKMLTSETDEIKSSS